MTERENLVIGIKTCVDAMSKLEDHEKAEIIECFTLMSFKMCSQVAGFSLEQTRDAYFNLLTMWHTVVAEKDKVTQGQVARWMVSAVFGGDP